MPFAMVLMLQSVTAAPGGGLPAGGDARPIDFDLARLPQRCPEGAGGEVVVCADRDADLRFRVHPLPDERYAARPVRAEIGVIGNVKAAARVESGIVGPGAKTTRAMIDLTLPF